MKDETGNVYGRLTALEPAGVDHKRNMRWRCECVCGNETVVSGEALRKGGTKSCGCQRRDTLHALLTKDETGNTYGRLTVLAEAERNTGRCVKWICLCDCGAETIVSGDSLRKGMTRSCGCLQHDWAKHWAPYAAEANITHGHTTGRWDNRESPTHASWHAMKQRCLNPNASNYAYYGGRGIDVCARWRNSFGDFLSDVGERPEGKTLDRIDVDGHYAPGNVRWATPKEQSANRRLYRRSYV